MPEEATSPPAEEKDPSQNIVVAVRVRPLNTKEKARQSWSTVEVIDEAHVRARMVVVG